MTEKIFETPVLPRFFEKVSSLGETEFHRDMTQEDIEIVIMVKQITDQFMQEPHTPSEFLNLLIDKSGSVPTQLDIILSRLDAHVPEMKFDPRVILLAAHCCANPVQCVVISFALVQETRILGKPIDVYEFLMHCIPHGLPTDHAFTRYWRERGTDTGNQLNGDQVWQ